MTSFALVNTLTILLFISPILLTTANAHNVRDFQGNQVLKSAYYYIRPYKAGPDNEGSLTLADNSDQNCTLFITQGYGTYTPVVITTYLKSKYIPLNTQVSIGFQDNTSPCKALIWFSIMQSDIIYIVAGFPTLEFGDFHIVDAGINQKNVYRLKYCDDEDDDVGGGCADVGRLANSSHPYLALIDSENPIIVNPFYFELVPAF